MKTILRITKTELQTMFYSPVAWFILIIFAFQSSLTFINQMDSFLQSQNLGHSTWGLSSSLFASYQNGVFTVIQQYLYLYIPLLTMGLMSREVSSGSIKLLFSSPVKNRNIIIGKYLSMMIYGLALMGILFLLVICAGIFIKDFDYLFALSGLLGIYLLICAYSAIGLFMSCMISYQVAVAVGTFVILAALNYIGNVGQEISFVREITYWLSIKGRSNEMITGLICSEDVFYFIIVISLFLSLSVVKLNFDKKHVSLFMKTLKYVGVVVFFVALGYITSRPSLMTYKDMTKMKEKTIIPQGEKIMKNMNGGLTITTYVNLLDRYSTGAFPGSIMFDKSRFKDYIRFKPEIKMKYIYYYHDGTDSTGAELRSAAQKVAIGARTKLKYFMPPEEIAKIVDLKPEDYRLVRLIERENGEKTYLRVFNDIQVHPGEAEILSAFKKISMRLPKFGFLTGHGERDIHGKANKDFSKYTQENSYRYALINQGMKAISVSLSDTEELNDVDILVIGDVREPFGDSEIKQLEQFIESGKNIILLGDVGGQEVMNPILELFGMKMMTGTIVQKHEEDSPALVTAKFTEESDSFADIFQILREKYNDHVLMNGAVGLEVVDSSKYSYIPLLESPSELSWNKMGRLNLFEDNSTIQPLDGEQEKSHYLAYALSRKVNQKEQRILIVGDADFISNGELNSQRRGLSSQTKYFMDEIIKWMSYGEVPINSGRKIGSDNELKISNQNSISVLKIIFLILIPLTLIVCGFYIWILRKKR